MRTVRDAWVATAAGRWAHTAQHASAKAMACLARAAVGAAAMVHMLAHAASVAQDLARAAQQSAKAGGLGGVTKKKKGKKKLGNAVGTRATPGFAAKRTTKDLWKPGGAHTIF